MEEHGPSGWSGEWGSMGRVGGVVSGGAWAEWVEWLVMNICDCGPPSMIVLYTHCSCRKKDGELSETAQLLGGEQEEVEREHMD